MHHLVAGGACGGGGDANDRARNGVLGLGQAGCGVPAPQRSEYDERGGCRPAVSCRTDTGSVVRSSTGSNGLIDDATINGSWPQQIVRRILEHNSVRPQRNSYIL
jgi:hypothetical protein